VQLYDPPGPEQRFIALSQQGPSDAGAANPTSLPDGGKK